MEQPGEPLLQGDIFSCEFGVSLPGEKMQINQPFRRSLTS